MITVNKANPTAAEERTSLVNASDGAGLHFDGSAGYIDIASPPDLGTKFSFEFVIKADSWGDAFGIIDFGTGGRFLFFADSANNDNLAIYDTDYRDFGVAVLDDLKVHHLTLTVDGTAATLYDNGNQVATTTLGAAPTVDACTDAKIGSNFAGTNSFIDGTIYRARVYNRTLSADEVQTAYERADVDFADQYGSQTEKITAWTNNSSYPYETFTSSGTTISSAINTSGYGIAYSAITLEAGKKYRITYDITLNSGTRPKIRVGSASTSLGTSGVVLDTDATGSHEFTATSSATKYAGFWTDDGDANNWSVANFSFVQIGAVVDLDLAAANSTQSRTVQDRAGVADGTASTSGVTQVQPVVQVNATSARIGTTQATPADGDLVVSGMIGVGNTPSQKLTVDDSANDMQMRIGSLTNGIDPFVRFQGSASDGTRAYSDFGIDAENQKFYVKAPKSTTPTITALTIDSIGNVSVGGSAATKLLTVKKDGGGSQLGIDIHNTGTATGDDAVISYECQGLAEWVTGIDRSASSFVIAGSGADLATNPRLTINSTGQVQILQNASDLSGASALKVTGTAYGTNKTIEAYMNTSSSTKSLIYAENSSGAVFNVRGDGLAEFGNGVTVSGDTKLGNGLVSNYVTHVSGLDDTVAISFTFPSQSSRYIHQLLELRVAMGDDGANTATPTFLRYAFTTLTTASGITQMDASLGTGITVATSASGTTLTVTLTEGSAIAMDSVTVFATVTSGHGDAKCSGMTVA